MWTLLPEYLLVNRKRIAIDLIKVYLGSLAVAIAIFLQAAIYGSAGNLVPQFSIGLLISCVPGLMTLMSHTIAGIIIGVRIARMAGLPLGEYVKTDFIRKIKLRY